MTSPFRIPVAAAATIAISGATANAALIYAIDSGAVYSIDPDARVVTQVLSVEHGFDIAAGPEPGALYVVNEELPTGYVLYRWTVQGGPLVRIGVVPSIVALGEGRDQFLYGGTDHLVRIDPLTAQSTELSPTLEFAGDLATSPAGIAYGSSRDGLGSTLVQVDLGTGNSSAIGAIPNETFGLAFTLDGRLWASDSSGTIYSVDPATGASTPVFNTGLAILDMASEPDPVPSPPSALPLLVAAAAATRTRRRPANPHSKPA